MSTTRPGNRGVRSWALAGLIAGLTAGAVFIVFVVVAWATRGSPAAPIRMISAILLGQGAFPMRPAVGLASTALVQARGR